ncbi:MAG: carbon-nitrogen hydrolase family protein [Eubacteriales bacterium]
MLSFTAPEDMTFQSWSAHQDPPPAFSSHEEDGEGVLAIAAGNHPSGYAKWVSSKLSVRGKEAWAFSVEYRATEVAFESRSVYFLLTWTDDAGKQVQRNYVDGVTTTADGWRVLQGTYPVPVGAVAVHFDLALRFCPGGSVRFRRLRMLPVALPNRTVRVGTAYMTSRRTFEGNVERMLQLVDKAGRLLKPDILCFTETVASTLTGLSRKELSQPIPGPLTELFSARAREHGMYIILPMHEVENGLFYNTALLLGRQGEIIGKYRKTHITLREGESGATPGDSYPVFDLDFGRVGIMICWDQMFPEVARMLRLGGAEIIFLPSYGDEPLQQRARARDNGIPVVVSGLHEPKTSRIIDSLGEIIGEVQDEEEGICVREIDLARRQYTYHLSFGPCLSNSGSTFMRERHVGTYDLINADGLLPAPPANTKPTSFLVRTSTSTAPVAQCCTTEEKKD